MRAIGERRLRELLKKHIPLMEEMCDKAKEDNRERGFQVCADGKMVGRCRGDSCSLLMGNPCMHKNQKVAYAFHVHPHQDSTCPSSSDIRQLMIRGGLSCIGSGFSNAVYCFKAKEHDEFLSLHLQGTDRHNPESPKIKELLAKEVAKLCEDEWTLGTYGIAHEPPKWPDLYHRRYVLSLSRRKLFAR